jgi:dihydrofolate reductase
MLLSAIVAYNPERAIGQNGGIPWHLPADLKYFRETTTGHCILMGRKTYASLGRPLPNRTNIVVSRRPGLELQGCTVVQSLEAAVGLARSLGETEAFVIGGGELYRAALPLLDRLYVTEVDCPAPEADVFFPDWDEREWTLESRFFREKDAKNPLDCVFSRWARKGR